MLIFSPMINAFIGAQDRLYNQSKVDSRLNEVVEFIKRDVRNAKSSSSLRNESVGIFDDDGLLDEGTAGEKVIIYTIDSGGNAIYIQYALEGSDLKLKIGSAINDLGNNSTVLSDVEKCEFKYKDKILLFYFKIDVPEKLEGKVRNEVRDVAITRINLQ